MVEGCPVLHLDDSTEDIGNLCGLLFGMYQVASETVGFSHLGTMLRLGCKYEISNFKIKAIKRLHRQNGGKAFQVLSGYRRNHGL